MQRTPAQIVCDSATKRNDKTDNDSKMRSCYSVTLTISSLNSDSHMPCIFGVQVPDTQKSLAKTGAPIKSMPDKKGSLSSVRPAIIGSQNQGENLK